MLVGCQCLPFTSSVLEVSFFPKLQKKSFIFGILVHERHATDRRAGAFFAVKWSFFGVVQGQACLLLPIKYLVVVRMEFAE